MASENKIYLETENCSFDNLCNFFGDRGVFFCKTQGDVFTSSPEQMLKCFEILVYVDGLCFWKLIHNSDEFGLVDSNGILESVDGEISVFDTKITVNYESDDFGDSEINNPEDELVDVIEQWKQIPSDWFQENYKRPNIRELTTSF